MNEEDRDVVMTLIRWAVGHLSENRPENAANCLFLARFVILESAKMNREGAQ